MRTLLKYSALLAAAVVLLPIDGFAQGRGQGGGGDQAHARDRAQVERGQTDHDRDRIRDRDRIHQPPMDPAQDKIQGRKQVQEQQRIHVPDTGNGPDSDIYGHALMSVQERNQYREQLRMVESDPQKKTRFLAQHREQMQARAKAQGVVIDDGEREEAE
jgi:hypothetical protein